MRADDPGEPDEHRVVGREPAGQAVVSEPEDERRPHERLRARRKRNPSGARSHATEPTGACGGAACSHLHAFPPLPHELPEDEPLDDPSEHELHELHESLLLLELLLHEVQL